VTRDETLCNLGVQSRTAVAQICGAEEGAGLPERRPLHSERRRALLPTFLAESADGKATV